MTPPSRPITPAPIELALYSLALICVALCSLALVACEARPRADPAAPPAARLADPAAAPQGPGQALAAPSPMAALPVPAALAQPAEQAAPPRVRKHVDLGQAHLHPQTPLRPASEQLAALRPTRVPLLWPEDPAFLGAALATAGPDWYSLSATYSGMTVVVQGDRVATVDPEMIPAGWVAPSWSAPLLGRNEGIVEATFLAWGASYAVSIECADPAGDERCTGDAAVLALVAQLRRPDDAGRGAP